MTPDARVYAYLRQTGRHTLTPRQRRRAAKKAARHAIRTEATP
jgi:hypothetical protein